MQSGKVRAPIRVARHNLAVEHGRLGWVLVRQPRSRRETFREVMAIAAIDHHARAHLVDLHTAAVKFTSCSQPLPAGTFLAVTGLQGWMKRSDVVTPTL